MDRWNRLPGRMNDLLGPHSLPMQGFRETYTDNIPLELKTLMLNSRPGFNNMLTQLAKAEEKNPFPAKERDALEVAEQVRRQAMFEHQLRQLKAIGRPFDLNRYMQRSAQDSLPYRAWY